MKKIILIVSALVLLFTSTVFIQSCTNEDRFPTTIDSQEANIIASEYVELINNQYVLNLTEEKAITLGISKHDYARMQTEVCEVNALIIEYLANDIKIDIINPRISSQVTKQEVVRLKNGSEQKPPAADFSFKMPGEGSKFAPTGTLSVEITITSSCFLSSSTGKVKCLGQEIAYTVIGLSGGSTSVNLPASNTTVTVTGSTNCAGREYLVAKFKS